MKNFFRLSVLTLVLLLSTSLKAHALTPVDLELSLLLDVSTSVSSSEFILQKQGYVDAFTDAAIISAIENGTHGAIAVSLTYWSSADRQQTAVDWMLVNDTASASALANAIAATTRPFNGLTGPGSAINFAAPKFFNNAYDGDRLVIDVSGDGQKNSGDNTAAARDAAFAQGITINGLSIGGNILYNWYNNNIKTTDGFVIKAANFNAFGAAIKTKIALEIGEGNPECTENCGGGDDDGEPDTEVIPEPVSMILFGSGLMGAVFLRRKKE